MPNVVLPSAVPKSIFARSVCSGTRPSRYHSRRDISAPPSRPPHWTRTPRAPERIAVCTARRIARRNDTRPASCSATPCASSVASVSGRVSHAAEFMSSTFTSTRFFVTRSTSLRIRSTSAPLRPITMPGRAVRMYTQIWSPLRSMSMLEMPARDRRERMCLRIQTSSWSWSE